MGLPDAAMEDGTTVSKRATFQLAGTAGSVAEWPHAQWHPPLPPCQHGAASASSCAIGDADASALAASTVAGSVPAPTPSARHNAATALWQTTSSANSQATARTRRRTRLLNGREVEVIGEG
ncbi:hypothetical protein [Dokdonella sp.]|uniref:hypothetical protein n=1 Tax=Dokdonella sp. TaxID=2291710 RepID=UPI002F3E26E2